MILKFVNIFLFNVIFVLLKVENLIKLKDIIYLIFDRLIILVYLCFFVLYDLCIIERMFDIVGKKLGCYEV